MNKNLNKVILTSAILGGLLLSTTTIAGGSILGGHSRKSNPDGVMSIGLHICDSLECPPIRIIRAKNCDSMEGTEKKYGVCLCKDGYVAKDNTCIACPEHANCSTGTITCDEGYHLDGDGEKCDKDASPCPSGTQNADGTCSDNSCTDNSNCSTGKYCKVGVTSDDGWSTCHATAGTCEDVGTEGTDYTTQNGYTYTITKRMSWDAADNWCKAVLGDTHGLADKATVEGLLNSSTHAFYNILKGDQASYLGDAYWLNELYGGKASCRAYAVFVDANYEFVYGGDRYSDDDFYALCK